MEEIILLNGNNLEIKGAKKVVSSTSSQAVIETVNKTIVISGDNIEVRKLNLEEGEVEFAGEFSLIKLAKAPGEKQPLFKRIFR